MGRASRKKKEIRDAVAAGATVITQQMLEDVLANLRKPGSVDVVKPHGMVKLDGNSDLLFVTPEDEGAVELEYEGLKKIHSKGDSTDSPSVIFGPDLNGIAWSAWGASYDPVSDTTTTYFTPALTRRRVRVQTPFGVTTKEIVTDNITESDAVASQD